MPRKAGSRSAGYHYDATPKGPPTKSKTPVVAPKPGQAAKGPAGDYKGASADYVAAVEALPAKAQRVTEQATLRASRKRATAQKKKVRALLKDKSPKAKKASQKLKPYKPPKLPSTKPPKFEGKKTAGTPTLGELKAAKRAETLKVNKKGAVTTPKIRVAARRLKKAKKAVARSQPGVKGLAPEEKAVVPLARKAHRKYPDVPVSVLMSQIRQESGFQPEAVSSAGAQGLSQFIPSTAESYNVRYGTSPKAKQSQVTGQAHYRHDLGFAKDPQGALSSYSGGYAASDYNNPVLAGSADYKALDKRGNPKAVKKLQRAKAEAEALGLKGVAEPKGHATKKQVTRFKAAKAAAQNLEKMHLPYVWGGGHVTGKVEPGSGLDCSGAVSYVLQRMGVKLPGGVVSGDMGAYLKPGPGAVTVFYNPEHTFMRIGNKYFGTSGSNPGGGAGFIPTSVAEPEANSGSYSVGHVPGLGQKVALALGVKGTSSFPGMTLSSSGTTATINSGAGATVGEPGFSQKPIKLTPLQKVNRAKKKLKALSSAPPPEMEAPTGATTLADLERKYSKAAA